MAANNKIKKEAADIIKSSPERMQEMLQSVYGYNSIFADKEQLELLANILFSMSIIDRKFFVSEYPYIDTALSVGYGQTISQPSTVARMLLLAELRKGDNVLEIGAGSGWNACLITFLVYPGNVLSLDRVNKLVEKAKENVANLKNYLSKKDPPVITKLRKLSFQAENVFDFADRTKTKYDKIIITAGIPNSEIEEKIENIAKNLLKQNGVLICPYTNGPMLIFRKKKKLIKEKTKENYVFVPLLLDVDES